LPCVGVMIGNSTGACPSIASVALRSVVIVLSLFTRIDYHCTAKKPK
jgi:hypothetical protein